MFKRYLVLFLFLFYHHAISQLYESKWYNTDSGLSQNSIKDLVKDASGFLWIATENGILRYDGQNFITYNTFKINNQMFKSFYTHGSADSIYISNAYEEDAVYIYNRSADVANVNAEKWYSEIYKNVQYFYYYNNDLTSAVDERMNYFVRTGFGKYFLKNNELEYKDFSSHDECKIPINVTLKNLGRAFVIDNNLFFLDHKAYLNKKVVTRFFSDAVFDKKNTRIYWSQANKQVFLIDGDDIYRVLFAKGHLTAKKIMTYQDFWKHNFNVLLYDSYYDKLFLGSSTKGLCVVSFPQMKTVKSDRDKGGAVFYAQIPFGENSVISPHGIEYNDRGFVNDWSFPSKSDKYNMVYDKVGNVLVKHFKTVYSLLKENDFKKSTQYTFDNEIGTMSHDGDLYFLSFINNHYTGDLRVYQNADFASLKHRFFFNTTVNDIIKLDDSTLLIGCRDGLYTANLKTNKTQTILKSDGFFVRNFTRSKEGNLWVLTHGKGFYIFKNNAITRLPNDPNNYLLNAHCIIEDEHGYFWISTNNGLFKVSKQQLLLYYKDRNTKVVYYRYHTKDGLLTNEFNGGCTPCGNILKNGQITFPSLDGIVFFDPNKVKTYLSKEKIYIERALVDDKEVYFKNVLKLNNNFSRADIYIDLPYFENFENIFIEAKLNDNKWEHLDKDRIYSISSLSYGNYVLSVRLKNINGKFINRKIKIIVPPLYYQTNWFKGICLLLTVFSFYTLFRLRLRFLKARNLLLESTVTERTQELTDTITKVNMVQKKLRKEIFQQKKLVGTISHDITTPIKFLSIVTKDLYETDADDYKMKKEYLAAIYKSTQQLYDFTTTLKDYAELYSEEQSIFESESYSLYDLFERKKLLFETVLKNDVKIRNNIHKSLNCNINKKVLSIIIHNLLDNGVKNTVKGEVVFSADIFENYITIYMLDTGTGMNDDQLSYYNSLLNNEDSSKLMLQKFGMGLHLVMQMLEMINGTISFKKNTPQGTHIKLTFKTYNGKKNNSTY